MNEIFDVVVVGGGITGAGVALDAASRGLRTALVERDDFASGTSSKSSKLVHGGLRYLQNGDVQEFRYARDLKRVFQSEKLAYLNNYGEGWGYMASSQSAVFVDNHDTERGGDTLNYKNGADYTLANVFMLGWQYGSPDINSGYEWSDKDAGPPNGGTVNACWQDGWKCQHACVITRSVGRSVDAALGGFYRRLKGRRGGLVANLALARKIAEMFWRLMVHGRAYVEEGLKKYEEKVLQTEQRLLAKLARKYNLVLQPKPA